MFASNKLMIVCWASISQAQWIFPPPLPADTSLSDYTSGKAEPIHTFHIHDSLIGKFSTPRSAMSITRCAKQGRTEPILPSNESFISTQGHLAEDGTWQVMDGWIDWYTANHYSKGQNMYVTPNFKDSVGNETTGHICWWELYSVSELQVQTPFDEEGVSRNVPEVTLLGDKTDNYFASTPFVVNTTMRAGGRNVTWRNGDSTDNKATSTTLVFSNRPTDNVASEVKPGSSSFGFLSVLVAVAGVICGVPIYLIDSTS
jgi:hypothetical protein